MAKKDSTISKLVCQYANMQCNLKNSQESFNEFKSSFESAMEEYFASNNISKRAVFTLDEMLDETLTVNRIEKTSIVWDANKLEKKLTKPVAKQVIKKQYRIADMDGLASYLRSCRVDPKEFRKYLLVDKTVDQDAVDRLSEVGQITVRNVSGCYVVKCNKPYFTVSLKKGGGNGK